MMYLQILAVILKKKKKQRKIEILKFELKNGKLNPLIK